MSWTRGKSRRSCRSSRRAHRKGEEFLAGAQAGNLRGRTGIWFVATDGLVPSGDLQDHFVFVERLLYPQANEHSRVLRLRDVLQRAHSRAHVTCFWRGAPGERPPQIPAEFRSAIEPLSADIEADFAVAETRRVG